MSITTVGGLLWPTTHVNVGREDRLDATGALGEHRLPRQRVRGPDKLQHRHSHGRHDLLPPAETSKEKGSGEVAIVTMCMDSAQ